MANRTRLLISILVLQFGTLSAEAQHCGGPCEVPRSADPVSPNSKYTLSLGVETADWRYLFNWFWTENGEQRFRVESALKFPPARDFGFRRMFVSPSGNGFLVTGNAYAGEYLKGKEPPLFLFFDLEGNRLSELSLFQALKDNERKLGQCPNCDCENVLYVFADNPVLSDNGCFVELTPYESPRPVSFFLPFGCPVRDRAKFEEALEAAEWSRLSSERAALERNEIQVFLGQLTSDDLGVRTSAANSLLTKGFLARSAIRNVRFESKSGNLWARAKAVETKLRPLGGSDFEAMATDIGLLAAMLSFPEPGVVDGVRTRLDRVLPQVRGMTTIEILSWIKEHQEKLKWNAEISQYE